MSIWNLVKGLFPNVWTTRRTRNQIKSVHMTNRHRLKNGEGLYDKFDQYDSSSLGEFAERKHIETVETIKSNSYKTDGMFHVPDKEKQEQIRSLIESTISRIRLRNFLALLFWSVTLVALLFVIGYPVYLQITNSSLMLI